VMTLASSSAGVSQRWDRLLVMTEAINHRIGKMRMLCGWYDVLLGTTDRTNLTDGIVRLQKRFSTASAE
jgi:hypothetical protein